MKKILIGFIVLLVACSNSTGPKPAIQNPQTQKMFAVTLVSMAGYVPAGTITYHDSTIGIVGTCLYDTISCTPDGMGGEDCVIQALGGCHDSIITISDTSKYGTCSSNPNCYDEINFSWSRKIIQPPHLDTASGYWTKEDTVVEGFDTIAYCNDSISILVPDSTIISASAWKVCTYCCATCIPECTTTQNQLGTISNLIVVKDTVWRP